MENQKIQSSIYELPIVLKRLTNVLQLQIKAKRNILNNWAFLLYGSMRLVAVFTKLWCDIRFRSLAVRWCLASLFCVSQWAIWYHNRVISINLCSFMPVEPSQLNYHLNNFQTEKDDSEKMGWLKEEWQS